MYCHWYVLKNKKYFMPIRMVDDKIEKIPGNTYYTLDINITKLNPKILLSVYGVLKYILPMLNKNIKIGFVIKYLPNQRRFLGFRLPHIIQLSVDLNPEKLFDSLVFDSFRIYKHAFYPKNLHIPGLVDKDRNFYYPVIKIITKKYGQSDFADDANNLISQIQKDIPHLSEKDFNELYSVLLKIFSSKWNKHIEYIDV
jgi:hypothetical protein